MPSSEPSDTGEERESIVPEGVIRGIEQIASGDTASDEDLTNALDWDVDTETER